MFWNILILSCGAIQSVILMFLLLGRKAYRSGYGFLVAYIVVLLTQTLFKIAGKAWLMDNVSAGYTMSYHLPYLYGPLIWMFTKQMVKRQNIHFSDILHFVPFLYAVIVEMMISYPGAFQFMFFPLHGSIAVILQVISILGYHLVSLKAWNAHNDRIKDHFSDIHIVRMIWIRQMIMISGVLCTLISLLLYFIYITHPTYSFLRFGFISLTVFIYWISYSALNKPQLFSAIVNRSYDETIASKPAIPPLVVRKPVVKYASSNLTSEEANRIQKLLDHLMHEERLYTEPELTIDILALKLNTNRHLLSQVMNQRLGQSFYDYINSWRVNEAKRLLRSPKHIHIKIASLAYDSGFNSLSAFNEVFRRMTGMTPTEFRRGGERTAAVNSQ